MKNLQSIRRAAALAAAVGFCATVQAAYESPNATYIAPGAYYAGATSSSGPTLKSQLSTIIATGFTARDYGDSRFADAVLDQDPANSSNLILMYNRASVTAAWDNGITWNREHIWPQSLLGVDVSNTYKGPASDLFELRPANPSINSSRGNDSYGQPNTTGGNRADGSFYFPGDSDKGDAARSLFYMATRYSGLTLINGAATAVNTMGDLASLLKYHYADPVDNFERRRNHMIYSSVDNPTYFQGNRNPFIDHPEYVWAIFGGSTNDSKIFIGGSAPADGTSSASVNLGRVMVNGTFGSSNVTITKAGANPTTFDLGASGVATAQFAPLPVNVSERNAVGTGQTFDYNGQSRTISVSLSSSGNNTTGLKSGTLVINNTDLTTAGTGTGSSDGNDTINVSGQVVANRTITATAYSGRVIRQSSIPVALSTVGDDDHFTRPTVKGNASGADAQGSFIAAGSDIQFTNSTTLAAARSITANFASVGAKTGTLNFTMQGEGLAGEAVNGVSVTYNVTAVDHSEGSLLIGSNTDAQTVDFGYVPQGFARSAQFNVHNKQAASGQTASMDIDSITVSGDAGSFSTDLAPTGVSPIAGGATNNYSASVNSGAVGDFSADHTIAVSDENIPGATSGTNLVLTTSAKVTAGSLPTTGTLNLLTGETWSPATTSIGAGATVTKTGPGAWQIGVQSHGAGSKLIVAGANVSMSSDAGSPGAAPLAIQVGQVGTVGASITFNATQHLSDLKIIDPNVATMAAAGNRTLYTDTLSIDSLGTLDLADNDLVVNNGTFSDVKGLVLAGFGATSGGITSSTSDGSQILALFDNALVGAGDWNGDPIGGNAVVGKYTYFGDVNFDGQVTGDDYTIIDSNLNTTPTTGFEWLSGDANLDGIVTGDDYTTIDSNLGLGSGNPLVASALSATAVPEPGSIGVLLIGGALLGRRRRR